MAVDAKGTCATAAATVAKEVTISGYTPTIGDLIAVTYTLGNSAKSPTLNVNGGGAKTIWLGGQAPTGTSGTGGAYCAANGVVLYYFDGTRFNQLGSNDITDADTTAILNTLTCQTTSHKVHDPTVGGTATVYYAIVGVAEDGTLEKVTATTSATAAGSREFSTVPLSLAESFYFASATTTEWKPGNALALALYDSIGIGTANWKNAIGEYYNLAGTLVANTVTTDLVQSDLYLGGVLSFGADGSAYIAPSEFSLLPRNPSLAYKRIGRWSVAGYFTLVKSQPVCLHDGARWRRWDGAGLLLCDAAQAPSGRKTGVVYYTQEP